MEGLDLQREKISHRSCKSKKIITKVMVLSTVSHLQESLPNKASWMEIWDLAISYVKAPEINLKKSTYGNFCFKPIEVTTTSW